MRLIGVADFAVAFAAFVIGLASLAAGTMVWRSRNGGMLTRAVVVMLVGFFVWSGVVFGSTMYLTFAHVMVSDAAQFFAGFDRAVYCAIEAFGLAVLAGYIRKG